MERGKYIRTPEIREKCSRAKIGVFVGRPGKKHSSETRMKISLAHKGVPRPSMLGDKNPRWNGGVTPVRELIRFSLKYRTWREEVFKGDGYICVECGARNGQGKNVILEADHFPVKFSEIINGLLLQFGIENLYVKAMECEKLWDVDNGRTLCWNCHNETKRVVPVKEESRQGVLVY